MAEFSYLNPFGKYFLRGKNEKGMQRQKQFLDNAQGVSENEGMFATFDQWGVPDMGYGGEFSSSSIKFSQAFNQKKFRITKYREMEMYPEISDALDVICDEAIVADEKGNVITLTIKKDLPSVDKRMVRKEFEYISNEVLGTREKLWEMYRKWLVEGEIFLELVLNKYGNKVIGTKTLASFITFPVYVQDMITSFMQYQTPNDTYNKNEKVFPVQQLAYAYWPIIGSNKIDVRGYLEPCIRTYNQLKNLEDALVVYRLVRAPERRIWNIEVGRMPTGKAEEYLKKLIHKYKRQISYNSATGEIDSTQNVQALTEDFWFASREGQASTVQNLQGGLQLGEIEDVNYFLRKMYKTLKVPRARFEDPQSQYNPGANIEREEIKFNKFVERTQYHFKKMIMDVFIQQLRLRNYNEKLLDRNLYDITFTKSNYFKEYKEMSLREAKINIYNSMSTYIYSPDNLNGTFADEFVKKNLAGFTDEEFETNKQMLEKAKQNAGQATGQAPPEGGGADLGGLGGADEFAGGDFAGGDEFAGEEEIPMEVEPPVAPDEGGAEESFIPGSGKTKPLTQNKEEDKTLQKRERINNLIRGSINIEK